MHRYEAAKRMGINLQLHDIIILSVIILITYIAIQILTHGGIKNAINQLRTNIKAHRKLTKARNKKRIKNIRRIVKSFRN